MLAEVEEYRKGWLSQIQLLSQGREKALDAQADLLAVSAGQLAACAALGRLAVVSGGGEVICKAAHSAEAMEGLLAVSSRLCTGTHLAVLGNLSSALACLEKGTRLQQFQVDVGRSDTCGDGLATFAKGEGARNVFQVTCRDSDGLLADWATLEDTNVGMTLNGVVWQVDSAVLTGPGVVQVAYVVEEGGAEGVEVEVGVSLCGVAVPGSPWHAYAGFQAKGVFLASLPPLKTRFNIGLAISSDGSLVVVCNSLLCELSVYQTLDGKCVRSFGCFGTATGEFRGPQGLCMTCRDTVLVADWNNKRIQELTLEGAYVRSIQLDDATFRVAVHGDVVAVTTQGSSIRLYSCSTGALIRQIHSSNDADIWVLLCFTPDGKRLAVTGFHGPITVLSVDGQTARRFGFGLSWMGLAFTCTEHLVAAHRHGVIVFSAVDDTLLRSWQYAEDARYCSPAALAVHRNRLYVLDGLSARVDVFE